MLALHPGMERLSHEMRDRQVRMHSVSEDLKLGLPPNIALPDGEEIPYGSSTRLQIRDHEQESEIYQKCVRPPPNRTVFDGESPPPYRSSSAGLLALGGGAADWSSGSSVPHVVRCHSLSSSSGSGGSSGSGAVHSGGKGLPRLPRSGVPPVPLHAGPLHAGPLHSGAPTVIVPAANSRTRRLSAFSDPPGGGGALANLTMVPCRTEGERHPSPPPPCTAPCTCQQGAKTLPSGGSGAGPA